METHGLFLTISLLSCMCHGWEVQLPESVQAVEGSCVMVSCQTNPHKRVNWYKYQGAGYPVVYSTDTADILPEFKGRTSVPGSPSQGNCTLQINSVRKADNGIYVYPYIYPDTTSTQYKYIKINVVKPEIHISVDRTQTEGNLFSASCTVRHSCPSSLPPIEWVGLASESNEVNTTMVSAGLWTSVAHAQFKVNRQDSSRTLSCKSKFSGNWKYSRTVSLNVLHAPIDVKIDGADGTVVEGASVSLTCTSTSNPGTIGYEWLVTQKTSSVKHSASKTFNLRDVKRDTSVSYTALNSVGRGQSGKVLLKVHFPPTILQNSTCFGSSGGIRCVCRAEAEPKANILWTVDGSSALLPLFNTTTQYVGRITESELIGPPASNVSCKASNILGTDSYQMPIEHPLTEGNSGLIPAVVAVVVCILGIAVVAVYLKKRSRTVDHESSGKSDNQLKTDNVNLDDNIYTKNEAEEDIYVNTMDDPQISEKEEAPPHSILDLLEVEGLRQTKGLVSICQRDQVICNSKRPRPLMETHKLFLTISVLSCMCHGWEVQVPESVQAVEGSCVMVSCHTSPHERVNWYKYKGAGYPVVYSTDTAAILPEFKGRTSVPGSPSQGNCTLQINSVSKADNGLYVYPYIYPDTSGTQYKYIKINVVNPEIHISVDRTQTEGNLFSASCTVRHSCPSSLMPIEWVGLASESNEVNTTMVSAGLWTLVAHAQFKVNRQDSSRKLSCKSKFSGNWKYSRTVSLNVLHAPIDVKIDGADGTVVEGASVPLNCTSTSNPEPTGYEWVVTQKTSSVKPSTSKTFDLRDVKRDTSVSCTAVNSVGRGQSREVLLKVRFPPTILENSTCFGSPGRSRCVCRAEAEPKANILWTVDGSSALLPLFNTTTQYVGRITESELTGPPASNVSCKASNIVGIDSHQMPIEHPLTEEFPENLASSGLIPAVVAVVVCILGIAVVAVCLKKRSRTVDHESSGKSGNQLKSDNLNLTVNVYANNAAGEDIYANTMYDPQISEDDRCDIYENY